MVFQVSEGLRRTLGCLGHWWWENHKARSLNVVLYVFSFLIIKPFLVWDLLHWQVHPVASEFDCEQESWLLLLQQVLWQSWVWVLMVLSSGRTRSIEIFPTAQGLRFGVLSSLVRSGKIVIPQWFQHLSNELWVFNLFTALRSPQFWV